MVAVATVRCGAHIQWMNLIFRTKSFGRIIFTKQKQSLFREILNIFTWRDGWKNTHWIHWTRLSLFAVSCVKFPILKWMHWLSYVFKNFLTSVSSFSIRAAGLHFCKRFFTQPNPLNKSNIFLFNRRFDIWNDLKSLNSSHLLLHSSNTYWRRF